MNAERMLARWREAGLIDEATAARIQAFEERTAGPARPYLFYALGGLGALSIAIGLISIVAANWDHIPANLKLGAALIMLAGLAWGVDGSARRAALPAPEDAGVLSVSAWALDVLVFLYYGATLAAIGLVAQVYHLGGEPRHAVALWSLVTLPLVLQGRGRLLMAVWLVALQTTCLVNVSGWLDHVHSSGRQDEVILASAALLCSLSLLVLGSLRAVQQALPQLAAVAASLGASQWIFCVTVAQQLWYSDGGRYLSVRPAALAGAGLALLLSGVVALLRRGVALPVLLFAGTLSCYVPLLIDHERMGLLGAFTFLGLWVLVGWYGLRQGALGVFNAATAVIAVRLLFIYFEVFGSLLNTGLGLLSGGLLTLALAWLWLRKVRRSAKKGALS